MKEKGDPVGERNQFVADVLEEAHGNFIGLMLLHKEPMFVKEKDKRDE